LLPRIVQAERRVLWTIFVRSKKPAAPVSARVGCRSGIPPKMGHVLWRPVCSSSFGERPLGGLYRPTFLSGWFLPIFFHAPCRRCLHPRPDAETLFFAPIWRTVELLAAKEGSSDITRVGRLAMKVPMNGRLQTTHLPNRQIVGRVGAARRAACRARIGCHLARGHRQSVRSVPRRVPSATRRTARSALQ